MKFTKPSWTKKQFAADCELNGIVQRFLRTGQLPNSVVKQPLPKQDFTDTITDFADLQQYVVEFKQQFEALPLEERNKFNNDFEAWAVANVIAKDSPEPGEVQEPGKVQEPGNQLELGK